jgi:hypothetical protein
VDECNSYPLAQEARKCRRVGERASLPTGDSRDARGCGGSRRWCEREICKRVDVSAVFSNNRPSEAITTSPGGTGFGDNLYPHRRIPVWDKALILNYLTYQFESYEPSIQSINYSGSPRETVTRQGFGDVHVRARDSFVML